MGRRRIQERRAQPKANDLHPETTRCTATTCALVLAALGADVGLDVRAGDTGSTKVLDSLAGVTAAYARQIRNTGGKEEREQGNKRMSQNRVKTKDRIRMGGK